MKRLFLSTTLLAAMSIPAAAGILGINVLDNGTVIDSLSGITTGTASLTTNDTAFSNITVNVQGAPILPNADLSTVTLDATASSGIIGTHTLTIDVFQTAVNGTGPVQSTFTINGLIGNPGPTTESTFEGGSSTTLGSLLATHTFPTGDVNDHFGPVTSGSGAFTADAIQYAIGFNAANQSFGGSAELTTNVPELPTWAMFAAGFAMMAMFARRVRMSRFTFGGSNV